MFSQNVTLALGIIEGGIAALVTLTILDALLPKKRKPAPTPSTPEPARPAAFEGVDAEGKIGCYVDTSEKPAAAQSIPEPHLRLIRDIFSGYVSSGRTSLFIDASATGVVIPSMLRGNGPIRLDFSYRFAPGDLEIGETGVSQTLSFSSIGSFKVSIPWSAVLGVGPATDNISITPVPKGERN
jgi:hypothetical protein